MGVFDAMASLERAEAELKKARVELASNSVGYNAETITKIKELVKLVDRITNNNYFVNENICDDEPNGCLVMMSTRQWDKVCALAMDLRVRV